MKYAPDESALQVIRNLIHLAGDNPDREGLRDTPKRVLAAYLEIFSGYHVDIEKLFTIFEKENYDEMVLLRNIGFTSFCEHHLLPFHGVAHVAYIPKNKIVGISKLARIVDAFARRLQVQERITTQITETLDKYLLPLGSACVIEAAHQCMVCRGVKKNATMVTSSLTGVFREKPEVRSEFLSFIKGG